MGGQAEPVPLPLHDAQGGEGSEEDLNAPGRRAGLLDEVVDRAAGSGECLDEPDPLRRHEDRGSLVPGERPVQLAPAHPSALRIRRYPRAASANRRPGTCARPRVRRVVPSTARAVFRPGWPVTPPPGCVPAPER